MKKILLFSVISFFANAQERVTTSSGKTVILNTDNTWKYDDQQNLGLKLEDFKASGTDVTAGLFDKIKLPIKNGEDQIVNVGFSFIASEKEFKSISLDKINKMIDYSRDYLMLYLKNKYSFIPRKLSISFSDSKKAWIVMWEYTAKNSYGGETEGNKVLLYDNDAKRIEF